MGFKFNKMNKDEKKKHPLYKVLEFYSEYTKSVEIIFNDEIIRVYF